MSWLIWGKHLSIEWRSGTGLDLEFVDSRPVYTQNSLTGGNRNNALSRVDLAFALCYN